MAGPWFKVLQNGDDWQQLDTLWISDGKHDGKGRIEMRVELVGAPDGVALLH